MSLISPGTIFEWLIRGFVSMNSIKDAAAPTLPGKAPAGSPVGQQIVLDLYGCPSECLDDPDLVKAVLTEAALRAGATIVDTVFHKFSPWGISGVVVIAESHLAIHTWPERHYAAIDIFTCGGSVDMKSAVHSLKTAFKAERVEIKEFLRGDGFE